MRPDPLPPSLRELEDLLAQRPCPGPAADFRARVLGAMTDARSLPIPERPGRRWRGLGGGAPDAPASLSVRFASA